MSISDPFDQAMALAQVTGALAAAGHHEQATAVIRSISSPYGQAVALAQVTGALAAAGQYEEADAVAGHAETTARSTNSPYGQTKVLMQIAEALARAGHIPAASRRAAAICATEPWTTAIRPVLLLKPSACTLIMTMLETR